MTSLEFERILSASGPTMGHLVRPSDQTEPKRIAWLQCVGSRDTNRCGNGYCSSVCCMYAIKEAMIAKEHAGGDLDCAIFNMDIRTFGKDYEKYYHRAKDKAGVRFVKARIHTIDEVPRDRRSSHPLRGRSRRHPGRSFRHGGAFRGPSGAASPRWSWPSVWMWNLDKYKFAATDPFTPVETSRPGVYACGVFQGPKDIPTSVTEASAAACAAGANLAAGPDTLHQNRRPFPKKSMWQARSPGSACLSATAASISPGWWMFRHVREYATTLPNVVYAGQNLFTCCPGYPGQDEGDIQEHQLNRVVVAACTPKTHEAIFMDTLEACGLNKYLFEMANIRNQDSWVHSDDPRQATAKGQGSGPHGRGPGRNP